MVLIQLRGANDQVASALLYMRQRKTYPGNSTPPWLEPNGSTTGPTTHQGSLNPALLTQDSLSNILEIVQSSRQKARIMDDVAVQATRGLREGEDAFIRNAYQKRTTSCKIEANASRIPSPKPNISNDGNEMQFPTELMSHCMVILFMIKDLMDRQYPPAEVAEAVDFALTSLQPSSPQNLVIYREIETCMGIIKNQMLALIPISSVRHSSGASIV